MPKCCYYVITPRPPALCGCTCAVHSNSTYQLAFIWFLVSWLRSRVTTFSPSEDQPLESPTSKAGSTLHNVACTSPLQWELWTALVWICIRLQAHPPSSSQMQRNMAEELCSCSLCRASQPQRRRQHGPWRRSASQQYPSTAQIQLSGLGELRSVWSDSFS